MDVKTGVSLVRLLAFVTAVYSPLMDLFSMSCETLVVKKPFATVAAEGPWRLHLAGFLVSL